VRPEARFSGLPPEFWSHVRSLSAVLGYTIKSKKGTKKLPVAVRVLTPDEIRAGMATLKLSSKHLVTPDGSVTEEGRRLIDYFQLRADLLNDRVQHLLMDASEAAALYREHFARLVPKCPQPLNKQKGDKKAPAFLTCLVNMLIEEELKGLPVDFDPRVLTTFTKDGVPVRTLARRVDGAFPGPVNPIAIWEIKEYYYTTTFGSRVADAIYETLLDGMELKELNASTGRKTLNYLFVDAKYTWWVCGRSYLCRLIDLMHMGYVDEIIFGKEVVERLPDIVVQWRAAFEKNGGHVD
jgi:hypothetical protein